MNNMVNKLYEDMTMSTEIHTARRKQFDTTVIAALETTATRRARDIGHGPSMEGTSSNGDYIDRTAAIVEAAAEKIDANDFSAVETLFAGQALALDALFDKLARERTHDNLKLALRAQQQCRATFKALIALKTPPAEKFSRKRTVERANPQG
jgi:hypothetical protein